ncbi:MAG: LLM class flavin-dependent oxidoreductase [Gammaproteobacteria bacterium]|uniref:LLM class flavin-dependent oxidoreductase n=1 Tax=Bradyrhizobium sp. TaxID=376 RepID=UPI003D0AF38D
MDGIKFGLFLVPDDIATAQRLARQAESDGFYSVSHNDHFYSPLGTPESPQLECFTALTAIAAVTEKVRLVPAVVAASFRTPALLAKTATSLDIASDGRFVCGLGTGWQGPEYEAHGYPFPPIEQRLEELEETIRILKAMWTQASPAFAGKHFTVKNAYNNPRPVQKPHPPIMIGGSAPAILEITARHADIANIIPPTRNHHDFINDHSQATRFTMERMEQRIALLRELTEKAGRDPADIEISGLVMFALSEDKDDPELRQIAANVGFSDYAAAQAAPVMLAGTPDEVKREIERRQRRAGLSYYIGFTANERSYELLVRRVIPAFRQGSA